jgi:hypothetical protein
MAALSQQFISKARMSSSGKAHRTRHLQQILGYDLNILPGDI